jgi:predicted DCC family thiol-disulfide oxidoreductase YuxK
MRAMLFIPPPLRDAVYDYVARNRIKWFGRPPDACRLPSPDERERFLP